MIRNALKIVLFIVIISGFISSISTSVSYKLEGNWQRVSNPDEAYSQPGWITYSIKGPSIAEIEILESGSFSFAWKMDRMNSDNKLYFKNELLNNTIEYVESYSTEVKANETLKWVYYMSGNDGGQVLIALPPQTATSESATSGSVTSGPVTSGPVTSGPVTGEPATSGPVTCGPVISGPVTSKYIVNEQELYDAINSGDFSQNIFLSDRIKINKTIRIENRNNLFISSADGLAELDGDGIDILILIEGSSHIDIKNIKMNNTAISIKIKNSSCINISGNVLSFYFPGKGIIIEGGGYNTIYKNYIYNCSNSTCILRPNYPEYCEGINLTSTRDNYIFKNIVYSSTLMGNICQYVLTNSTNKGNEIHFSELTGLVIAQDQFIGEWNPESRSFDCFVNTCQTHDCTCRIIDQQQEDSMVWEP